MKVVKKIKEDNKVSIIVPVYNVVQYLPRCLDSLINQTLDKVEIICIDDCSKDESLEILKEYASKSDNIEIIALDKNSGVAKARNAGIEFASGEFLIFVDPDDYIDLDFCEKLYKKAVENNAFVVKAQKKIVNLNNTVYKEKFDLQKLNENRFEFTHSWTCAIYKSTLIKSKDIRFMETLSNGEDGVFLNKVLLNVDKVYSVDDVFYYYCRREESLDSKELSYEKVKSIISAVQIMTNDVKKQNLYASSEKLYKTFFTKRLEFLINDVFPRNKMLETKMFVAKSFLKIFNECLCKEELEFEVDKKYKKIFMIAKTGDVNKIYKQMDAIFKMPLHRKIFHIKNDYIGKIKHKTIYFLGMKIKFKCKI